MNLSLGYLKDALAIFLFTIAFYIVYTTKDLNILRPLILVVLFVAFLVDSLFTLYPDLHNTHIELLKINIKKYLM